MLRTGEMSRSAELEHGFTLLELVVVLAIMGLMAIIAAPISRETQRETQARGSARILAADLRWLRQQALSRQREVILELDIPARRYHRNIDRVEREIPVSVGVEYSPAQSDPYTRSSTIRFFADGTSTGGTVILRSAARVYTVSVAWPFGRVRYRE